jgi:hypothetical protein
MKAVYETKPMPTTALILEVTQDEYDTLLREYSAALVRPGMTPAGGGNPVRVDFLQMSGNLGMLLFRLRIVPTVEWPESCDLIHELSSGCRVPEHYAPGTKIPRGRGCDLVHEGHEVCNDPTHYAQGAAHEVG